MNDKILEAVKALGGDLGNIDGWGERIHGYGFLTLERRAGYRVFMTEFACDEVICTVAEFNTYAEEWLKEAYMHNAAIDLEWDVANTRDSKYIFQYQRGRDPVIIVIAKSVNDLMNDEYTMLCTKQEFIDYCEANNPKPKPVFTQAMADAGELPPVGCKVEYPSGKGEVLTDVDINGVLIVVESGEFKKVAACACKPIKSPRDKAIDAIQDAVVSQGFLAKAPVSKEISVKVYDWLKQLTPEQRKEFDL